MEVILLRHAATRGNLLHQYIGRTDLPLADSGKKKAALLQEKLPTPDLLFVSPMVRCRQTASLVWPQAEQIVMDDLKETDFGDFEEKTWQQLKDDPCYRNWIDGRGDCPGGESRASVTQRVMAAWRDCVRRAVDNHCIRWAVVAHGGTLMEILSHELGGEFYQWQTHLSGGWRLWLQEDGTALEAEELEGI